MLKRRVAQQEVLAFCQGRNTICQLWWFREPIFCSIGRR